MKLLWRTIWFVAGRVVEGEIDVGDVMSPVEPVPESDQQLAFTVAAIETYGHAISFLSTGSSGQLIMQLPKSTYDDLAKLLPPNFELKADC